MGVVTKSQAKLLRKYFKSKYGRNYSALFNSDNPISIGSILRTRNDTVQLVDGAIVFPEVGTKDGQPTDENYKSASSVSIDFKASGTVDPNQIFETAEAGLNVSIESEKEFALIVRGLRQRSVTNFADLRSAILSRFTRGDLEAKVFVVRGLVVADRYILTFGANKKGNVVVGLSGEIDAANVNAELSADLSVKWTKDVGYTVDATEGGVLAYRVSAVRLRRHLQTNAVHGRILDGLTEAEALDSLSVDERGELFDADAFEVVDCTLDLVDLYDA